MGVAATKYELKLVAQTPEEQEDKSPYEGCEWKFDMSPGTSVPIGRSKAKKFLATGVSMPKDNGVSTSHAKVRRPPTPPVSARFWLSDCTTSLLNELF